MILIMGLIENDTAMILEIN